MTWRDISTAPRDGTPMLLACADWPHSIYLGRPVPMKVGGWDVGRNRWEIFGASWRPTHWMPLPDPPSTTTEAERIAVMEGK